MSERAELTDGLASLKARRTTSTKRRPPRRSIPASMNPTSLPPYDSAEEVVPAEADTGKRPVETPDAPPTPVAAVPPAQEAVSGDPRIARRQPPRKVGLYLDEEHQDYFEAVRAAGNTLRPRVNLSASAVVRLALDRLGSDLTVEEVRDVLVGKPTDPHAVGRKRR